MNKIERIMWPITWFARVTPDGWKKILSKGNEYNYEVSCTPVTRKRLFADAKREAIRRNRTVSIETELLNGETETYLVNP